MAHKRTKATALGWERDVCSSCGTDWPCVESVKETCERLNLAEGLPCGCGHHDHHPEAV